MIDTNLKTFDFHLIGRVFIAVDCLGSSAGSGPYDFETRFIKEHDF